MKIKNVCQWCEFGKYDHETNSITCAKTEQIVEENDNCTEFQVFDINPL